MAGTGMTAFETETAKSCRSLGRDPAIIPSLASLVEGRP
jgi:hypothetical protein